jgi:hypothetical protein
VPSRGKVEKRLERIEACPICKGMGWVCENHPDKSWPEECSCGAGEPCVCNTHGEGVDTDFPPDVSKIFKNVTAVRGKKVN